MQLHNNIINITIIVIEYARFEKPPAGTCYAALTVSVTGLSGDN